MELATSYYHGVTHTFRVKNQRRDVRQDRWIATRAVRGFWSRLFLVMLTAGEQGLGGHWWGPHLGGIFFFFFFEWSSTRVALHRVPNAGNEGKKLRLGFGVPRHRQPICPL